jgi:molybdopterin/thiamine biosynthesis adenylyltransferase
MTNPQTSISSDVMLDLLRKNKSLETAGINLKPISQNKVLVPEMFDSLKEYTGGLYGYMREDSGIHVIIGWDGNEPNPALRTEKIGAIGEFVKHGVCGTHSPNGIDYIHINAAGCVTPLQKEVYSINQDLFSRNSGILETREMKDKTVLIVGCGSVGSTLALQLARAGVGQFVLVDTDTIEIHNICRHQCNLTDLGRFKTDALYDRIIAINPEATVTRLCKIIENITKAEIDDLIDENSIIVGCGDNRLSDAFACELAYEKGIPFVSIGFWQRAFVCEIVTCIPKKGDTCYRCALKKSIETSIENMNKNRHYIDEIEKAKVTFEPGISIDIEFGTCVGSKIVVDALNIDNPDYISKVLHTLTQYTLICNTNSIEIGGEDAAKFSFPLQVARNIRFIEGVCSYCEKFTNSTF